MNCLRVLVVMSSLALCGCDNPAPLTGQAQADAATRSACRQRADQVYNQQNRGEIYSPALQVNTPFSASYQPDQADRGLAQLFAHDKLISDCVRNTGTGSERSQPLAPVPPGPAGSGPAPARPPSTGKL
ncbi:hypothetical protein [Rhodopila sp.]|uniref:hypothetical protein n=1 Tax=Rhodopila sp. TaxID=2480087 RepID=UPI003D0AD923